MRKSSRSADLAQHLRGDLRLAVGERAGRRSTRCASREAQARGIRDRMAVHLHGEHLGLEAGAVADRARHLAQVLRPALALRVGLGLEVLALDVGHDALEAGRVPHLAAVAVLPLDGDLVVLAAQDRLADLGAQHPPRGVEREVEVAREALEQALVVLEEALALRGPRDEHALADRELLVAEHELDVDRHAGAEARAGRAGAERRVERERARLDLGELQRVAVRAGELLGERLPGVVALCVDEVDLHDAAGEPERRLDGVGDAARGCRAPRRGGRRRPRCRACSSS